MTIIIPSSNLLTELRNVQKKLFKEYNLVPAPFPLLFTTLSIMKPTRPTRKWISENYPAVINLKGFNLSDKNLNLQIKETIPFHIDDSLKDLNIFNESGFFLNHNLTQDKIELNDLSLPLASKFNNYQLACYKIDSENLNNFWLNMVWNKIWEVKKAKSKN